MTTAEPPAPGEVQGKHILWLLSLGVLWGASYLFIKVLVEVASPSAMIAVRFALGASVLGLALALRGGRLPRPGRVWLHLLVMSVIANVLPFLLIAWSQQHATSAIAAVLNATTPLFTLLFAALVFRNDLFTRDRLAGLLLGFAGVVLLTGTSLLRVDDAALGELALLGSSLCYGFGYGYARRFVRGEPLQLVTMQLIFGFLITAPLALATGWVRPENLTLLNAGAWLILGAFGTGVAYIFFYALIGSIGPTRTSFVTYITPVVGVLLGWLLLDEYLGLSGMAGMLLIIGGIATSYGLVRRGHKEQVAGK
jgi:drug/metabolite transporter (DMT)-like permease